MMAVDIHRRCLHYQNQSVITIYTAGIFVGGKEDATRSRSLVCDGIDMFCKMCEGVTHYKRVIIQPHVLHYQQLSDMWYARCGELSFGT